MKEKTDGAGTQKMTESELSEKLGGMQRKEAVCILAALLGGIGCAAVLLIGQNIPVAALLFAVSAAGIAAGSAIRKKRKTLLQECYGLITKY